MNPEPARSLPLSGYRRALRYLVPYWPRLVLVLLAGLAATGFGLLQPYFSKLLIDEALAKRDFAMLLRVSGLMFAFTRLLFGARAGLFAALTLNLAPVLGWTTGSFVLPDGPLIAT